MVLEKRLLDFFRHECGHGHVLLRHVAEILRESYSEDEDVDDFHVTAVSTAAASSLGFTPIWELPLSSPPPQFFSASLRILDCRSRWADNYLSKYPHRKLCWRPWGSAHILWKHSLGQTVLFATELQAHILLAAAGTGTFSTADFEEAALAWSEVPGTAGGEAWQEPWRQALARLTELRGPLQEADGFVSAKAGCELAQLDLTAIPAFHKEVQNQAGGRAAVLWMRDLAWACGAGAIKPFPRCQSSTT